MVQSCPFNRTTFPISKPSNWVETPLPTTISATPGVNMRPPTIETLLRTACAFGPTPRSGRFALMPVDLRMPLTTT